MANVPLATVVLPIAPESIWPEPVADPTFPPAGRRLDPSRLRRLASSLLTAELPMPSPWLAYEDALRLSIDFYTALSHRVVELVHGSNQWQQLEDGRRAGGDEEILARVPVQAARRYEELGAEKVEPLFGDEHTHTSRAGAELNAECVMAGLRGLKTNPAADYMK